MAETPRTERPLQVNLLSLSNEQVNQRFPHIFLKRDELLKRLIKERKQVANCLDSFNSLRGYEDIFYRFYSGSMKLYGANHFTQQGYDILRSLDPKPEKN